MSPLDSRRWTPAVADGSQVAGVIALTPLTEMEAGPTGVGTGRGATMAQHSSTRSRRRGGMKCEGPSRILTQEGEGKETATCYSGIVRQEGDGAIDDWQRRGQEKDGVDPTRTEHPGTPVQTSQTVDPTPIEVNPRRLQAQQEAQMQRRRRGRSGLCSAWWKVDES